MDSAAIQTALLKWLNDRYDYFTAPYGIIDGNGVSKKGKKYLAVTFGCARTLDATIMIFNRNFILYKSNREDATFHSFDELMEFLEFRFPNALKTQ